MITPAAPAAPVAPAAPAAPAAPVAPVAPPDAGCQWQDGRRQAAFRGTNFNLSRVGGKEGCAGKIELIDSAARKQRILKISQEYHWDLLSYSLEYLTVLMNDSL